MKVESGQIYFLCEKSCGRSDITCGGELQDVLLEAAVDFHANETRKGVECYSWFEEFGDFRLAELLANHRICQSHCPRDAHTVSSRLVSDCA